MPHMFPVQDHGRMQSDFHNRQFEIKQRQRELDQHHNLAQAEEAGEKHRSPFVIRVLRRLFGRL